MAEKVNEKFWSKVEKTSTCWLWTASCFPNGYGQFYIEGVGKGSHRVAYELVYGQVPTGAYILHKCGIKNCVNPEHLYAGNASDNAYDAIEAGAFGIGPDHGRAKFTWDQIESIRNAYPATSQRRLARKFNVAQSTIGRIVNGKRYVRH